MRKGSSGLKTFLILFILAVGTLYGIYRLTETNVFIVTKEFIAEEAAKVSITRFKNTCKVYNKDELINKQKELTDKPIYYTGSIENIEKSPFGSSEVIVRVYNEQYGLDNNSKLKISIKEDKYLRANKGDAVEVYGKFKSIKVKNEETVVNIDGVRVIKK